LLRARGADGLTLIGDIAALEKSMDIRSAQKIAWANKLAKGFNTTNVPLEFCLLDGEIAEAFDAWHKGLDDLAEELADSAIFLLGLAEMVGVDLQEAIETKLAKNEARVYRRLPSGAFVKNSSAESASVMPPQ
jgi:NTP pyrophosphatase (non-canonical NTP hydrolase)